MKKMILSAMLLLSTGAYAVDGSDVTANCKTNNQSEVVIKFHNYNPVALISLQIKGQEYKSQAGPMSTSGGAPVVTIKGFPTSADSTTFNPGSGAYIVNGKPFPFSCSYATEGQAKPSNGF